MRGIGTMTTVVAQGKLLPERTFLNTSTNRVSPGYFTTLGIPLLAGRNLELTDFGKNPARVIVNRAFANFFFPHEGNIVGKAIVNGVDGSKPPSAVIVGLVGTAKYRSFREHDPPIFYGVSGVGEASGRHQSSIQHLCTSVQTEIHTTYFEFRSPSHSPIRPPHSAYRSIHARRRSSKLSLAGTAGDYAFRFLRRRGTHTVRDRPLRHSFLFGRRRSRELGIRIAIGAQMQDIVRTVCGRLFISVAIGLPGGVLWQSLFSGWRGNCCSASVQSIRFPWRRRAFAFAHQCARRRLPDAARGQN